MSMYPTSPVSNRPQHCLGSTPLIWSHCHCSRGRKVSPKTCSLLLKQNSAYVLDLSTGSLHSHAQIPQWIYQICHGIPPPGEFSGLCGHTYMHVSIFPAHPCHLIFVLLWGSITSSLLPFPIAGLLHLHYVGDSLVFCTAVFTGIPHFGISGLGPKTHTFFR